MRNRKEMLANMDINQVYGKKKKIDKKFKLPIAALNVRYRADLSFNK